MDLNFFELRWELVMIMAAGLVSAGVVTFFGMRMLEKSSPEELGKSSPKRTGSWRGKERRVYPHFPKEGIEAIIRLGQEDEEPKSARIVDRSLRGMAVEISQEVHVGQCLQLRLKGWTKNAPWVTLEVMNCVPQGNLWRAGCQFCEISPWEAMDLFGTPESD